MEEYHYFVAHEFSRQERDDLREAIEKAFDGTGLNTYYTDLEVRQTYILEKIKDRIFRTQFGIYDITNTKRPNVFIELGLAMAAEKPFYIICKKGTEVPADLAGLDRLEYESYKELTELLRAKIVKGEIENLKQRNRESYSEDEILKKCVKLVQAESEEMRHPIGVEVTDESANNKKAWYGGTTMPCPIHVIYGPYQALPEPGIYKSIFKIKIDKNSDIKEVLHIDVISNKNPSLNSFKAIRGIHFDQPKVYQLFSVEFKYQGETDVQYRVIKLLQERELWIDYVAIIKLPVSI
jgi:hypothetical protein